MSDLLLIDPSQPPQQVFGPLTIQGDLTVMGAINGNGIFLVPIAGGIAALDGSRGNLQNVGLSANTTSTAANFVSGMVFSLRLVQDATGGWSFSLPANFKNPPAINLQPNGVTQQTWAKDELGNYYPFGGAIWS